MSDKENSNKKNMILRRRVGQLESLLSRGRGTKDIPYINWDRELEGQDLKITTNSFRSLLTHSNFSLPLANIDIVNIKSLYDVGFKVSSLNLFAGKNSSGKSTILETLALISKWSFDDNTQYEGVPFGIDFGTLSFDDFRSFNKSPEPLIIKFKFNNILERLEEENQDGPKIIKDVIGGTSEITIELNDVNYNKIAQKEKRHNLKALKFAPIEKFSVKIAQDSDKLDKYGAISPVNATFEFNNTFDNKIKDSIIESLKIFENHVSKTNDNYVVDENGMFRLDSDFFGVPPKEVGVKHYSSYADIDITTVEKSKPKKTRIYGVYFDSPSKQIEHLFSFQSLPIDGFVAVKKEYLIRWLAIDYVMSNSKLSSYLIEELFENKVISSLETTRRAKIKSIIQRDQDDILNHKTLNESFENFTPEVNNLDEVLGLRFHTIDTTESRPSEHRIYRYLRERYKLQSREVDFLVNGYFDNSTDNFLLAWITGDTSKFNKLLEAKKIQIDSCPSEFNEWKEAISENLNRTHNFLSLISEKLVSDIKENIDEGKENPLEVMYKKIDNHIGKKRLMPILFNWSDDKFSLIEHLSSMEHTSSTYLAPLMTENKGTLSIKNTNNQVLPIYFSDELNKGISEGFKNTLSSTIFIGPLRERFLRDDDVFSFNFPFVLGKSGELTGSFLGTFGETIIDFPTPEYIHTNKTKEQSYFQHLSEWLEHIGIADEIFISGNFVMVKQGNNNLKLENVGVGVSQVLPILLSSMISKNNEVGELLLLEQPELHLHPNAQANLGDFFVAVSVSDKKTLFIETHSEHIVNRIKTQKVQLGKKNDKIKIYFVNKEEYETKLQEMEIGARGEYITDSYPDGFFDQSQKEAYLLMEKISETDNKSKKSKKPTN
jgi:predicted ATPase